MAYAEDLADRVRELIAGEPDVTEKKMFGGLAFLVGGNMSVAASGQGGLMVRVEPNDTDALVTKPHARPFEMRGRAMRGWLRVEAEGLRTKRQLEPWVRRGVTYARSLPSKQFSAAYRRMRAALAELATEQAGPLGPQRWAIVTLALTNGLALERLVDPNGVPEDLMAATMRLLTGDAPAPATEERASG